MPTPPKTTGRGDEDVDTAAQLRDLRTEADAAEQREGRELQMFAIRLDGGIHLRRKLAGGCEDQCAYRTPRALTARTFGAGKPLQHRQHEAGRLAGAGLRASEQVAACEHGRNGLHLDGGGRGVALIGDRAQQRSGQAKRIE